MKNKKPIFWGFLGAAGLLIFYFMILTLAESFSHALGQFSALWYWILALSGGFGIQAGLYSYVRQKLREREIASAKGMATSGGASALGMVACCAHHLVDALPIFGLSAAFVFLANYQIPFIVIGLASNALGILFLFNIIKKHALYAPGGGMALACVLNFKKLAFWTLLISTGLVTFLFIGAPKNSTASYALAPITDEQNGLAVTVTPPASFGRDTPLEFNISFNTHSGDLGFDLKKNAYLLDGKNKKYTAIEWTGGQGGHHLSGKLVFAPLLRPKFLKLFLGEIYGAERVFEWKL